MVLRVKKAFTIAEMMVVLLIISLVSLGIAKITLFQAKQTDNSSDSSIPVWAWRGDVVGSDVYPEDLDNSKGAFLSSTPFTTTEAAKLYINTVGDTQRQIMFDGYPYSEETTPARLIMDDKSNVGLGRGVLSNPAVITGTDNTVVGTNALPRSDLNDNTAFGCLSSGNTTSSSNTILGTGHGGSGGYNTIAGEALPNMTTGAYNTGIGYNAGGTLTVAGSYNIAMGASTQLRAYNLESIPSYAIAIGGGASNTAIAIGQGSLVAGPYNIGIGDGVDAYDYSYGNYNGRNIAIGFNGYINYGDHNVAIGATSTAHTYYIMLGGTSDSDTSYTVYVPGTLTVDGTATNTGGTGYWRTSDKRLKNIKGVDNTGIEKIKKLKVYNFNFKNDKKKTPHTGVIAQNLQKVFPDAVEQNKNGYLVIRKDDIFYAMINSIKEFNEKLERIIKNIKHLVEKINLIDKRIISLKTAENSNTIKIKLLEEKKIKLEKRNKMIELKIKKLEQKYELRK